MNNDSIVIVFLLNFYFIWFQPSLNGDENNEKASKITNGGSVWGNTHSLSFSLSISISLKYFLCILVFNLVLYEFHNDIELNC